MDNKIQKSNRRRLEIEKDKITGEGLKPWENLALVFIQKSWPLVWALVFILITLFIRWMFF